MPAVAPRLDIEPEPTIRPISVAEMYRMEEAGIFADGERVELLEGELVAVPRLNPPHAYVVQKLAPLFFARLGDVACVRVQLPVRLNDFTELFPDLGLYLPPGERYAAAHPIPAETLLVVEVSHGSLRYDAGPKLRAYARAAVREYWIVDIDRERVEVHRDPSGDRYRRHHTRGRGSRVSAAAFADVTIDVDELLLPRAA
jgi:Uma2 family endonuclease